MHFSIISASHQKKSNSLKVARYIDHFLNLQDQSHIIDLRDANLPIWTPEVFDDSNVAARWKKIDKALKASDGFVFITPEYAGMATPILKNFLLFAGSSHLGHKPVLIVSVSSGIGGSYPISELRASSYKNNRLCYVPDHIIVRYADKVLNEKEAVDDSDKVTRHRIADGIHTLRAYTAALSEMRKKNTLSAEFPNGM